MKRFKQALVWLSLHLAFAEQLKLMTSPVHTLSSIAELINWTFSGLSNIEERDNSVSLRVLQNCREKCFII